jgi:hypothetical protein
MLAFAGSHSFSSAFLAGSSFKFSATERLLRLLFRKLAENPFWVLADERV